MEPITETEDALRAGLEKRIGAVSTERELRACAEILNSPEFEALPFEDQVELTTLYADRHLKITGALLG